ncbi:MAG: pyridinium-3,5-bisthiocarboxylic acid mononucleotide nickel chelatase [Eubacteriaceae bacterium]|jgi:uncharacterized protein (TIGR00299 family) protein|nr:pyridinium-3,5-bisthiocarboxylic acid mononucleotide nickel chelatase [Eubacteriaceae bacterium]
MSQTLYLECYSGISGDMTVAALLDLGADQQLLKEALESLPVSGFEIKISRVKKAGLDVCDFMVKLEHDNHDHDMEYLHGDEHHHHEKHKHHSHEHAHTHRGLAEIIDIINQSAITQQAKAIARRIFSIIAEAEAKAHGLPIDQVHFHEVGAVDSIVDIVAVAVCLDNLGITDVIVPEIYEGRGLVRCQHGVIPVPVPAVTHIAGSHNIHLHITSTEGELITPTGAAIVAAIKTANQLPARFTIRKTGVGAGKRSYDRPSFLRAMLIDDQTREPVQLIKLETNIDDCTGEMMGYVMERLFEAGARDVHYSPVFMKKNRPGYLLNVICSEESRRELEDIIFEETTTLGIRRVVMDSSGLKRSIEMIETSLGKAQIKICVLPSGIRIYPEYDSVVEICERNGMSYQDAYHIIKEEAELSKREN